MAGWSCGSCGQPSPEGTRFCGHCGAPAAAAPAVQTWACRSCGTANLAAMVFCGGCGAKSQATRTEELRLVTALFADISGFTTLADSLDVESLHDVITPLVRGLTQIAERYEGFIEKFAGDALLVVYGAPVTHEDDAQRALLAALDMHAELPRLLAQIGPHAAHLTIHVGVNTGRVIGRQAGSEQQSDYAVLGDSVILAQRLESVCPAGETYVGPTTYELCKGEFAFEPVGELTLKGKLKPVSAFRLLGRRETALSAARPLLGRAAEVATLDAALDAASAGAGIAVLVSGEPGTGKSRLVAEVRAHAEARRMRWLPARCLSYGASLPYWPFADLLRQALGLAPDATAADIRSSVIEHLPPDCRPGAGRLLGLVTEEADPQRARREVHESVTRWVAALAEERPVVLCVEDVHWMDHASRDLLGELLRTSRGSVASVMTARPEGVDEVAPLLADVDARRVELASLGAALVGDLAAAVLDGAVAPALAGLLTARTTGNPLFVEELARSLQESGALVPTRSGWDVKPGWDPSAVPETVERVFATRLDALPVAAAGLLQVTSVVGRTVRLSLLAAVAGAEFGGLAPLNGLVVAGLLDEVVEAGERAVTFHHALLHDVVYGRLLRKRRRELHRRVADVASRLYGEGDESVDLLARHLYLAEAGPDAVDALLRAGRRAARLYANDEAAVHLERAVEVLRGLPEKADALPDVLLELGEVQEVRGEYDQAQVLYEQARRTTGDVRAWRGLAAVLRKRGDYPGALDLLDDALQSVGPTSAESGVLWLERGWSLSLAARYDEAAEALQQGLEVVPAPAHALRGRLLAQQAHVDERRGRHQAAIRSAEDAEREMLEGQDEQGQVMAARVLGGVLLNAGRVDEGAEALQRAVAGAERTGAIEELAGALLNLAIVEAERGDAHLAVEHDARAIDAFERIGHGSGRAVGYGNIATHLVLADRLDEAEHHCEAALAVARRIGHASTVADVTRTRSLLRRRQGRLAEAVLLAEEAASLFLSIGELQDSRSCLEEALEIAVASGDAERQSLLSRRLERIEAGVASQE